jgi:hypothetical protein
MVEYDPLALSYGQLLDIFLNWRCGELSQRASFQNVPSVFVKNEFEKRMAQAAAARYGFDACGGDVRVTMSKTFYKAEKWCQKHFLRMFPALMDEVRPLYADEDDLIQSTLATRLNGILGQQAQKEFSVSYVPEDFEFYDLSDYAVHILRSVMPQNCIA